VPVRQPSSMARPSGGITAPPVTSLSSTHGHAWCYFRSIWVCCHMCDIYASWVRSALYYKQVDKTRTQRQPRVPALHVIMCDILQIGAMFFARQPWHMCVACTCVPERM
jgi:hypothetical protein